jgi:hypothetical protein
LANLTIFRFQSVSVLTDQNIANFLLELIARTIDEPNLLSMLKEINVELWKIVRTLSALYGSAINAAYYSTKESPNSWKSVVPKICYEVISEQWLIILLIEKYSGERTIYEEDPSTLLQLVSSLLKTLTNIPSEDAPATIDRDDLAEFKKTYENFFKLFTPKG